MDLIMDLYFLFDLGVSFRTAYTHPNTGKIVGSTRAIACNYLSGWFAIDIFSSVPLAYIELLQSDEESLQSDEVKEDSAGSAGLLKVLRILRLSKLLRVVRVTRLMKKYLEGEGEAATSPALEIFLGFLRSFKLVMALVFLGECNADMCSRNGQPTELFVRARV
jgi:hypothetical protein